MQATSNKEGCQEQASSRSSSAWEFWHQAFAINGSITPHVLPNVLLVGLYAGLVCTTILLINQSAHVNLSLPIAPYEFIGATLGVVLVLRTNAGYERWWEARKLWGGIVNQSRNLAIAGLSYGPQDPCWQKEFVAWASVLPYITTCSLRGERPSERLSDLIGQLELERLANTEHMPSQASLVQAKLLRQAYEHHDIERLAFLELERQRATLIDHIGACERILKTPLALAYAIKIRRFIAMFLLSLPFALIESLKSPWLATIVTMLVAYPLFSLDQLGVELQNPFSTKNLSHLPLDEISSNIEGNLSELLVSARVDSECSGDQEQAVNLFLHQVKEVVT